MSLQQNRLGSVSWHYSLDKEVQDANLWTSCSAVFTKTPNQVKLIIPKAGPMAHAFQPMVCTGEVEPQRGRLSGIIDVEVIADGVSCSGQGFSTKQHSKGPHHRTRVMPQSPRPLLGPLPSAHKPCKLFSQTRGTR